MYEVYRESSCGLRLPVIRFRRKKEAVMYCDKQYWAVIDEYGLVWDLNYRKVS